MNYAAWRAHVLTVLRQQIDARGDPVIQGLFAEVSAYPAPPIPIRRKASGAAERLATPLRIATRFGVMSFLGTVTVFGTPNDVTLSELALEMLFPADEKTAEIAKAMVEETVRMADGAPRPMSLLTRHENGTFPSDISVIGARLRPACRSPLAPGPAMVHIGAGRLAKDVPLANRVRSGRKQP